MINNFLYLFIVITGFFVTFSTFFDVFGLLEFLLSSQESLLTTAIIVYNNADTEKSKIISDNKGKAGIYLWTHKESGKNYVGSSSNLKTRLSQYFNINYLERNKTMYICNALKEHGYSAFSFSILEYINITDLSKDKAKILILEREQFYFDSMKPEYNLLPTAGSRLGSLHLAETLAKMSEINSGENNPMYGKRHTFETLAFLRKANSGIHNPMFGKNHSEKTKALMSLAKSGENHPKFGKYKKVFVYTLDSDSKGLILHKSFDNSLEAIKYFNCSRSTLTLYLDKNKLYKKQWFFFTFEQK